MTALRGEKSFPPPVDCPRGIAKTRRGNRRDDCDGNQERGLGDTRMKKTERTGRCRWQSAAKRAGGGRSGRPRRELCLSAAERRRGTRSAESRMTRISAETTRGAGPGRTRAATMPDSAKAGFCQPSQPRRMAARTARTFSAMSGAPTSSETSAQHFAPRRVTSAMLCSLMPPMATKGRRMLATTHSR